MENPIVVSPIDTEVVLITLTTLVRLFDLDSDAALLYLFYCKTAKIQSLKTGYHNSIWATRSYSTKGLHWGNVRYHRAKQILLDNHFIEDVKKTDDAGRQIGQYIKIQYLLQKGVGVLSDTGGVSQSEHLGVYQNPQVDFRTPNTINEKESAKNQNKSYRSQNPISVHNFPQNEGNSHYRSIEPYSSKNPPPPLTQAQAWKLAREMEVEFKRVQQKQSEFYRYLRDNPVEQTVGTYAKVCQMIQWALKAHEFGRIHGEDVDHQQAIFEEFLVLHPDEGKKTFPKEFAEFEKRTGVTL